MGLALQQAANGPRTLKPFFDFGRVESLIAFEKHLQFARAYCPHGDFVVAFALVGVGNREVGGVA